LPLSEETKFGMAGQETCFDVYPLWVGVTSSADAFDW
jgi:hypothetical protein